MNTNLLKPYTKNAKKHDKKQVQQIANSIKEFGFNQPIVLDKDNVVIVGHGRLEAAKLLGLTDVPTITVDLTEEQAKAYRLADNKLNESEWDMGLVIDELKGLSDEMLDLTGFDRDLVIEPDEKDDVVPENAPPVAKLGDIWQLGRHRLMCGDSTDKEAVARLMGGSKADMVFTDPPYGVNFTGAKYNPRAKEWSGIKNDDIQGESLAEFIADCFVNASVVSNEATPVYAWSAPMQEGYQILNGLQKADIHVQSQIIWHKNTIVLGQADYQWKHEICWYGWTKGKHHYWNGGRSLSTVWDIKKDANQNYVHPTQKPTALAEQAITNSCRIDGSVLDLFGGSGSTLIAAEKTNRTAYLMELDPKYVDVIIKRWEDYTNGKAEKISG